MKMKNMKTLQFRTSINRSPLRISFILFAVLLTCSGLSPGSLAQLTPAPDGGYPNHNTAEGEDALFSLTGGFGGNTPSVSKRSLATQSALTTQQRVRQPSIVTRQATEIPPTGVKRSGTAAAQLNQRLPFLLDMTPPVPAGQPAPGSIDAAGLGGNRRSVDGTAMLKLLERRKVNPNAANSSTIPFWSDSFTYQGLTFNYRMVGTDPKKGSTTTVIPTEIIPLRFVFADGSVFDASTDIIDGQTPIQGIVNSPIFQNYDFVLGGTHVGNTQWADAFQRGNFWNSVSTRAPNYHVLLSQPTVLPTQTIMVPADKGTVFIDPVTSHRYGIVDSEYAFQELESLFDPLNIQTTSLPIFVSGSVYFRTFRGIFVGIHFATQRQSGVQTYIITMYDFQNGISIPDTSVLSHEVAEWMDDPFIDNYTPGWNFVGRFNEQCRLAEVFGAVDRLEVADPLETTYPDVIVALSSGGNVYHVVDLAFIDFFTRNANSRSVNGQYYMFQTGAPSSECVGQIPVEEQIVDFPGSLFTDLYGINNHGDVVGFYRDQNNVARGFLFTGHSFSTIEPPGSVFSKAIKITDSGQIVGYFFNSAGQHGFSYQNGAFQTLDFPGAVATLAFGVNSAGDITGISVDAQFNAHGFILTGGHYLSVDAPFGNQTEVTGINSLHAFAGVSYGGALGDSAYGFVHNQSGFVIQNMPGALATIPYTLNNTGMTGGIFELSDGYTSGYVNLFGYFHQTTFLVLGNNDLNQIVGLNYDYGQGKYVGVIGTLPLAENVH